MVEHSKNILGSGNGVVVRCVVVVKCFVVVVVKCVVVGCVERLVVVRAVLVWPLITRIK